MAELFRQAGYATAGFQANFLLTPETGYDRGFDRYAVLRNETPEGPGKVDAAALHAQALDWLRTAGARPFFLYLQSIDVHIPYSPPAPYLDMVLQPPDPKAIQQLKSTVSEKVWEQFVVLASNTNPDHYDGAIAYADNDRVVRSAGRLETHRGPPKSQLFDLRSDPSETTDVSATHPLQSRYLTTLATTRPPSLEGQARPRGPTEGLTEEQRRKRTEALRALGYIQ